MAERLQLKLSMKPPREELDSVRIASEDLKESRDLASDKKRSWHLGLFAVGRVFLGAVFIGGGVEMLADYGGTLSSLQETVIDLHRWVPLAIGFQLAAGAAVALGLFARAIALTTAAYLVIALLLVPPDLASDLGRAVGFANIGLVSALCMVAAHGAGALSLDHLLARRRRRKHALGQASRAKPSPVAQRAV